MQTLFTSFSEREILRNFFSFIRPQILTTTDLTECPSCFAPALDNHLFYCNESRIAINDYNPTDGKTLKQLVEEHFNEPRVEEMACNYCDNGKRFKTTKYSLVEATEGLIIALGNNQLSCDICFMSSHETASISGRERYDANTGVYTLRDRIELGGDVNITTRTNENATYYVCSAIQVILHKYNAHFNYSFDK